MKSNTNKFLLTAALSVAMVGCGGGGSDDGGGGGGGPSIPLVEGSMVSVNVSGKDFQEQHVLFESMASNSCEASTAYFETDNVMAYSAASHTEGELQKVASTVEYAMERLVGKFGFGSVEEFNNLKRTISHPALRDIVGTFTSLEDESFNPISVDQLSPYFADNPPEGYTGWDDPEILNNSIQSSRLVRSALMKVPNGAEVALIVDEMITNAETLSGMDLSIARESLADGMVHDKIQVCVLPDHMKGAAEGHTIGFNIAATEQYSFYVHEGTHFVQKQYAEYFPRWFTEGQAVAFAGQEIASSKSSVDIMSILAFEDEQAYGGDFYEHYGLAYKALAANASIDEMIDFLQGYDLQPSWEVDMGAGTKSENYQFAELAFADAFINWPGGIITYDQFADQYANLAK